MRLNIDKLMIGFVMILAVCLYAPTLLEDYKANSTTNEKVTEAVSYTHLDVYKRQIQNNPSTFIAR